MPNTILCDSDFAQDERIEDDTGTAQDITGWTFEFLFRPEGQDRSCKSITLTNESGISLTDPTNGELRISLTASQTKQFGPGVARCLLWRTDSGMRKIIAEGSAAFEGKAYDA